jgi:Uma2 family endonuclease
MELSQSALECEKCMVVGEMDWKINDETILRPDILLVCNERNEAYISKTPEIVVEVISPSTARRDEKFKFEIYENEKVLYYVMIYPSDCKAKIYKLKNGKFDKEGDFFKEAYTFEDASCGAKVDFENVFSRFCK